MPSTGPARIDLLGCSQEFPVANRLWRRERKLDEELHRMSEIVDMVSPNSLVLLNESFASTNEHEGSEIARQIIRALMESDIKVSLRYPHVRPGGNLVANPDRRDAFPPCSKTE